MINLTKSIVLSDPAISNDELFLKIKDAIAQQFEREMRSIPLEKRPFASVDKYYQPTFECIYETYLNNNHSSDLQWLRAAHSFIHQQQPVSSFNPINIDTLLQKKLGPQVLKLKNEATGKTIVCRGERALVHLKHSLRNILLHLWNTKVILLPFQFDFGRRIDRGTHLPSLIHLVANSSSDEMQSRGLKILLMTDWAHPEDVSVFEMAELHLASLSDEDPLGVGGTSAKLPFVPLLELVFATGKAVFSEQEVLSYKAWINGRYHLLYSLNEFIEDNARIIKEFAERAKQKRAVEARQQRYTRRAASEEQLRIVDFTKPTKAILLAERAKYGTHDAAVEYYGECIGLDRRNNLLPIYPGREHIDTKTLSAAWLPVLNSYLDNRITVRKAESNERAQADISCFVDYLFAYLPWWFEIYSNTACVKYPYRLSDFYRHIFLVPSELPINQAPLAFYEFSNRRKNTESFNHLIFTVHEVFEYAKANKKKFGLEEFEYFENPCSPKFDQILKGKRKKTNKFSFAKKHMPLLLRYVYALEDIGLKLQAQAFTGTEIGPSKTEINFDDSFSETETQRDTKTGMTNKQFINMRIHEPLLTKLSKYNIESSFDFDGRTYTITEIPPVFQFNKRKILLNDASVIETQIAHLGALRINIGMLETGLRGQSVQWLDRESWNHKNENRSKDDPIGGLWVNTDKVAEPGSIYVSARVISLFAKEDAFQRCMLEEGMDEAVDYEGRKHSRHGPIVPLFRAKPYKYKGIPVGKPISDNVYQEIWKLVMLGFQNLYNEQGCNADLGHQPLKICRLGPAYPRGQKKIPGNHIVQYGENNIPMYCPINLYTDPTPHSARVTFISSRRSILPIEYIRDSVRQANTKTTEYYTIQEYEDLAREATSASELIWDYKETIAHVRAANHNSHLRQTFLQNRMATIEAQCFTTASFLNEVESEAQPDALNMLKVLPIDELLWMDHCVCVFGGRCDLAGVLSEIEEAMRCGICPAGCTGIDHLTGNTAKKQVIHLRLVESGKLLKTFKERVNRGELPEAAVIQLEHQRKLDIREASGYAERERTLLVAIKEQNASQSQDERLFALRPEFIRRKLTLVSKPTSETEYILHRLADANVYSSLLTPEMRMRANQFHQRLLANIGDISSLIPDVEAGLEVSKFFDAIQARAKALPQSSTTIKLLELLALVTDGNISKLEE